MKLLLSPSRSCSCNPLRVGWAVGATVLAGILFVMPRYSLPDPGTTLIWGLPSGPTAHVVITGGVTYSWVRAFSQAAPWRLLLWGLLFAIFAEVLQLLPFVDRGVNWEDLGFNVLGVGVGLLLAMSRRWLRGRGR